MSLSFIQLTVNASYDKSAAKQYSQYGLDWGEQEQDFRNRYSKLPLERYAYDVMLRRGFSLFGEFGMSLSYAFADKSVSGDRTLYRLDKYKGWDSFNSHPLGYLPSTKDSLQQTMDWQNSYFSTETSMKHTSEISFGYHLPGKSQPYLSLDLPVNIVQDKLSYRRAALDTLARRNKTFFIPTLSYISNCYSERNGMQYNASTEFSYSFVPSAPRLLSLLDIRDDSNPLSIQLGNPYLKNEKIHRIKFRHTHNSQEKQRNLGLNVNWEMRLGAIGQSMMYDKESGVKTYTPRNINGNWNVYGSANWWKRLGHFSLRLDMNGNHSNRVSMINEDKSLEPKKSTTRDTGLGCDANVSYQPTWGGIDFSTSWNYQYSLNSINDNDTYTRNYSFRLEGYVDLPFGLQLRTDGAYSFRNGTNIRKGEDDQMLWNASASWRFLKKKEAELSAYWADILGKRKSFGRTTTSDGFYEFRNQEIKGYFIVTFKYNFRLMM